MNDDLVFTLPFVALFIGYLIYQVYERQNKLKLVNELITDFYREKGREVQGISKLSATERFKYGVPMSPYISFYYSSFSFLRMGNQSVCRSVESSDETGKEYISYVEVSFTNFKGMSVKEFDSYEF